MRLLATNGPLEGTTFPIADGVTVCGPDGTADREQRWFRIRENDAGEYVLQPVDRRTPLFLNGLPASARVLKPRDEVRFGDSLFAVQPDPAAARRSVRGERRLLACQTNSEPSANIRPVLEVGFDEMLLATAPDDDTEESRDLRSLMRVASALSSIEGLGAIDAALAGFVLDVIPAGRVVLAGGESGPAEVRSAWRQRGAPAAPIAVDGAVLDRVAKDGTARVFRTGDRDVVVAPMMASGRATGTLWAELSAGAAVAERDVQLLLVVAALVAVARERVLETARLKADKESLQAEINLEHNMVGRSRPMRALFDRIARVAKTESTILLRGESGTGKELVARAAHRNSSRSDGPFIAVNCAAITESLLESELFGHEKGAFTGAIGQKKGKLELADRGTLFLDEIGELPLALQAKLLRALQEREFDRVGGTRPVRVDFRLIAATNRDLEAGVRAGSFRQDLFYRLNVVTLVLPPLRDRKDDLPLLADYFIRKHAPRCGRRVRGMQPAALEQLERHDWPGNVRELENAIEQALALGSADEIEPDDLPVVTGAPGTAAGSSLDYHATLEETKRDLIVRAFELAGGSHAGAARLLGVHPNYLHRLMRNFNLRAVVGGSRR